MRNAVFCGEMGIKILQTSYMAVPKAVSEGCDAGVVFLLWGSYAQKKASAVDAKKHHLLK